MGRWKSIAFKRYILLPMLRMNSPWCATFSADCIILCGVDDAAWLAFILSLWCLFLANVACFLQFSGARPVSPWHLVQASFSTFYSYTHTMNKQSLMCHILKWIYIVLPGVDDAALLAFILCIVILVSCQCGMPSSHWCGILFIITTN